MEDDVHGDFSLSSHASTRPLPRLTRRCHSSLAHGGTLGAETMVGMRTWRPPQAEPIRARPAPCTCYLGDDRFPCTAAQHEDLDASLAEVQREAEYRGKARARSAEAPN